MGALLILHGRGSVERPSYNFVFRKNIHKIKAFLALTRTQNHRVRCLNGYQSPYVVTDFYHVIDKLEEPADGVSLSPEVDPITHALG